MRPEAERRLAHDIYKEFIEIQSGYTTGVTTPVAEAGAARQPSDAFSITAHACRHEWLMRNPMSLVRQSAKRTKTPDVLDADELRKLLTELQNPARAVVFLTAGTGLRISEALA